MLINGFAGKTQGVFTVGAVHPVENIHQLA